MAGAESGMSGAGIPLQPQPQAPAAAAGPADESSDSEGEHEGPQKLIRKVSTSGQIRSKLLRPHLSPAGRKSPPGLRRSAWPEGKLPAPAAALPCRASWVWGKRRAASLPPSFPPAPLPRRRAPLPRGSRPATLRRGWAGSASPSSPLSIPAAHPFYFTAGPGDRCRAPRQSGGHRARGGTSGSSSGVLPRRERRLPL
ncbi:forkhead box protein Q1-like [Ammospiza caudacuta]|uniref:forkhead box protein Q1-like n=1 Tax=Ammospiza caudacuta TaxID=2857398 RepID=UPI002739C337|nr:forkhead box protein Q1-like [Ammospiza caudacuta]